MVIWSSVTTMRSTTRRRTFCFTSKDGSGSSIVVDCLVYRRTGTANYDVERDYILHEWSNWMKDHKEGPLGTLPFPVYTEKTGFLVLPDPAKKKDYTKEMRLNPPGLKNSKDPSLGLEDGSKADQEKWGVIGESKGVKIKGQLKPVQSAWRFCMYGNRDRVGEETYFSYAFQNAERSYIIRVYVRKDGLGLAGDELKKLLDSFTLQEK